MLVIPVFLLILRFAIAFQWPWEDDESSSLLLAAPTSSGSESTALASETSAEASGTSDLTLTLAGDGKEYVPQATQCPSGSVLREATDINQSEKEYIANRQAVTNDNLVDFLSNVALLSDFDAQSFIDGASKNISIGLAFSGGGYRAMLCGAGELLGLDSRYEDLTNTGLGGLLQSSSYIAGLSGGSWLVGTLVLNDFISVADVVNPDSGLWNLDDLIFNPSGINLVLTVSYYNQLREAVDAKDDAGFETSITDVWGRALSYQFFNEDTAYQGGENVTWSSIRNMAAFQNYLMPFPVVVANGRNPGELIINENSTVFEFTPYELGSWDSSLNSFVDIVYLGTSLDNGMPNGSCVTNYDNAGFVLGTSSSLFNQALVRVLQGDLNWALKRVLEMILSPFSTSEEDIALYDPNPFYNSEYAGLDSMTSNSTLHLVDGGEDYQNIPLYPLIQTSRDVDIIFAYDNSADTNQWPNGSSLLFTYQRQFSAQGAGTPFPYVPDVETFLSEGLSSRPVFFGCDAFNMTELVDYHGGDLNETDIPLVVYMPNSQYLYEANTSTYKMEYDDDETLSMVKNGYEVSSRGNYSDDRTWPTCVGCAIIRREQERSGEEQSEECKKCFQNYCWVGGIEDTEALTVLGVASQSTNSQSGSTSAASSSATSTAGSASSTSGSNTSNTSSAARTSATSGSSGSSLSSSSSSEAGGSSRSPPWTLLALLLWMW